jgi:tRNA(Arg) A34 adenosine deaminase TadA
METNDSDFLKLAVGQAEKSVQQGGFPAGAVIVKDGKILAAGISIGAALFDPSAHAETSSIRAACKLLQSSNLAGSTLYCSMEPCLMCFSCANWANITRIVYACKRTAEMISKMYYEGNTNLSQVNADNNKRIDIIYLPDFEEDITDLIKNWEANLNLATK